MEDEILRVIYKLKSYRLTGWMNSFQIDEIIQLLSEVYKKNGYQLMDKLMDEISRYYDNEMNRDERFEAFVKKNMDMVAQRLNRSKRTIYRKLQQKTFTLVERKMIEEYIHDFNE